MYFPLLLNYFIILYVMQSLVRRLYIFNKYINELLSHGCLYHLLFLTFFLFVSRNLVDDKDSHQVHTSRTSTSGGCWQSYSQVF